MQATTDTTPDIHDIVATLQQQLEQLKLVNEGLNQRLTNQERENWALMKRIDGLEGRTDNLEERIDKSHDRTKESQPSNQAIQKGGTVRL